MAHTNSERLADSAPMGLIGLSIASAAIVPICFGRGLSPGGLRMAAVYCLLFGGGCQFLSGLICYVNKNLFGGTLFTVFSFMWVYNAWSLHGLAAGLLPDHSISLAIDLTLLLIFAVFTYAHGFFSRVLFLFLLDIALIFLVRVLKLLIVLPGLDAALGVLTIIMIVLALWLAFGILLNPLLGKDLFPHGDPLFRSS